MSGANIIEGNLVLTEAAKFAVVVGRFNHFVVDQLELGCLNTFKRHGIDTANVTIVKVPGAFEMPVVAGKLAASGRYDAIIGLGAVIRGGTPHFEHVAGACSRGMSAVATDSGVPVIFGVLTVDSIEQAVERAGTKAGNKGAEAATVAIEMVSLMRQL